MTTSSITARQKEILDYIREFIDAHGWSPSLREIGERFSIKTPYGVLCHLRALEKKGAISRLTRHARAIRVIDDELPDDDLPYDLLYDRIDALTKTLEFIYQLTFENDVRRLIENEREKKREFDLAMAGKVG